MSALSEERWFIVVADGADWCIFPGYGETSGLQAFSRRAGGDGGSYTGPWQMMTEEEAEELAAAMNDDEPAPAPSPLGDDSTAVIEHALARLREYCERDDFADPIVSTDRWLASIDLALARVVALGKRPSAQVVEVFRYAGDPVWTEE